LHCDNVGVAVSMIVMLVMVMVMVIMVMVMRRKIRVNSWRIVGVYWRRDMFLRETGWASGIWLLLVRWHGILLTITCMLVVLVKRIRV
jgi:hypothetical protein